MFLSSAFQDMASLSTGSSKYSWVCFVSSDYYKLDGTKHRLMSIHARRIQNRS